MAVRKKLNEDPIDLTAGGETEAHEVLGNYSWSLHPYVSGSIGTTTYTVQVSQTSDPGDFVDYIEQARNVAIDDALEHRVFPWRFIKVVVNAGTGVGTVDFYFMNKFGNG